MEMTEPRISRTLFNLEIRWRGGNVVEVVDFNGRVIDSKTLRECTFLEAAEKVKEIEQEMLDAAGAMSRVEDRV